MVQAIENGAMSNRAVLPAKRANRGNAQLFCMNRRFRAAAEGWANT
jgi:hypothetical protein